MEFIPSEVPIDQSPQWAVNIIHTCMAVQRGEKVFVVVDEPLSHVRDALLREAAKASPLELWSFTFPNAVRPFSEYPPSVLTIAAQMDVVILLLASLALQEEMPAWVAGRASILKSQARFAAGAFIDQSILDNELSADYHQIAALTQSLAHWLRGSSSIHITTPLGTDLTLSTTGREWKVDSGIPSGQGVYGNLPAGEVYIAPIEDSAEGVLVIDKSLPGLILSEPVRLVFEKGRVVQIEGGPGAAHLQQAIANGERKPNGEGSRVIAELGIGTNPKARLQGNLMTDEKVAGTIHVAIGRNDFIGGTNLAPIHIDGVVSQPTVQVDGRILIDNGKYVGSNRMAPLSSACWEKIRDLFPRELHGQVATLLENECGNNLPFLEKADSDALDRYRFAALELSDGDLTRLREAVDLAKVDWRDLLVAASRKNRQR